jgi:hypothetical protein
VSEDLKLATELKEADIINPAELLFKTNAHIPGCSTFVSQFSSACVDSALKCRYNDKKMMTEAQELAKNSICNSLQCSVNFLDLACIQSLTVDRKGKITLEFDAVDAFGEMEQEDAAVKLFDMMKAVTKKLLAAAKEALPA